MQLIKFFTISGAAFSGTPHTVPSSSTPIKRSPPKRFKNEQTDSYTSFSILFPHRLNSTAMVSPISNMDFIVFTSTRATSQHCFQLLLYTSCMYYAVICAEIQSTQTTMTKRRRKLADPSVSGSVFLFSVSGGKVHHVL